MYFIFCVNQYQDVLLFEHKKGVAFIDNHILMLSYFYVYFEYYKCITGFNNTVSVCCLLLQ